MRFGYAKLIALEFIRTNGKPEILKNKNVNGFLITFLFSVQAPVNRQIYIKTLLNMLLHI